MMRFLLVLTLVLVAGCAASPQLAFKPNGTFKIVQFTDLHYGDDTHEKDMDTQASQLAVLTAEKPDLVLITGDITSGWMAHHNLKPGSCLGVLRGVEHCFKEAVTPMEQTATPWATTYGNHDAQGNIDRKGLIAMEAQYELSLTQAGPANITGVSNYVLHVAGQSSPGLDIWALDSKSTNCLGRANSYGCIELDQIVWYATTSRDKARHGSPYGLMMLHIPPVEYLKIADEDISKNSLVGYHMEHVACPLVNTGFLEAVLQQDNVQTVICGHDHNNSFRGTYRGNITLAYGRKSGYGCYGPAENMKVGARVLEYSEVSCDTHKCRHPGAVGLELKTWIRNGDGTVEYEEHIDSPLGVQGKCSPA